VLNCTNAKWPDLYGHFREAKFSQTKHHWWWKANRIFDQLHATKSYNGESREVQVTSGYVIGVFFGLEQNIFAGIVCCVIYVCNEKLSMLH
jgi:hypothetical protein